MLMGISGNYDTNTTLSDLLKQQDNQDNQKMVQSGNAAPTPSQTQQGISDFQRLSLESNSLDSVPNKHSRNLIDIYA